MQKKIVYGNDVVVLSDSAPKLSVKEHRILDRLRREQAPWWEEWRQRSRRKKPGRAATGFAPCHLDSDVFEWVQTIGPRRLNSILRAAMKSSA
jgi:uncharacterized protein (DUF4415 family)